MSICIDWIEVIPTNADIETREFLDSLEHICKFIKHLDKFPNKINKFDVSVFFSHTAMILSVPCLIATSLIYICLPDLHRNLHGKCFLCYMICQAFCFILEILFYHNIVNINWQPIIIYLFLCAFQWLNVTAFDAWWNLRHFR